MTSQSENLPAAKIQSAAGDTIPNPGLDSLTKLPQSESDCQPEPENALSIPKPILTICERICFQVDGFRVEVESHLGQSVDVNYFQVKIQPADSDGENSSRLGLLRVGLAEGSLSRELQLREVLGDYKMISDLLACVTEELVQVRSNGTVAIASTEKEDNPQVTENEPENAEFLAEEFLEEKEIGGDLATKKLIVLSDLPEPGQTLAEWLRRENSLESSLLLASQICQLFRYVYQRGWCLISVWPEAIEMGKPVKLFDLTGAYPVGEKLATGIVGDYCPPELSCGVPIDEQMSAYVVGLLLYQSIHQQLPKTQEGRLPEIKPIARIAQIIAICLSPIGDRFPLSQLLSLLVATRQMLLDLSVQWTVASGTTEGLSPQRLQNEDSYGVKQQYLKSSQSDRSILLAAVADGMGGMAQGEEASRLAVQAVFSTPIPTKINRLEEWNSWLASLVKKANAAVAERVPKGGTTLSLVYSIDRELTIAHVGDSRIFLLRNGQICQLSEDHSLVAILLASGEITYEESKKHSDRNVLTKSIGAKPTLSRGYVQDLSHFGADLSISLEDGDILLLCTDGVWDLVSADELAEIFSEIFSGDRSLQSGVDTAIAQVLAKGAPDNATLLALQCRIESRQLNVPI